MGAESSLWFSGRAAGIENGRVVFWQNLNRRQSALGQLGEFGWLTNY